MTVVEGGYRKKCSQGHIYYKKSDCPVCPVCEAFEKSSQSMNGLESKLSGPAYRALVNAGIDSVERMTNYSEKELLKLHGFGKASIPIILNTLKEMGLTLKK